MTALRRLRRSASLAKRWLLPSRDVAAWRRACRIAERTPRRQRGAIAMNGYQIHYADLLTLCPQWHDIFVDGTLSFTAATPTPRILDCGANVGLASLYFKKHYPGARITAYEADPTLAAICRENLRANEAADVDVVASAVWTENGRVRFRREGADAGAIDLSGTLDRSVVDVSAVRLCDVIGAEPIDLLKLDIEGAEGEVLADCADRLDRVNAIIMDLHEFNPDHRQTPAVLTILEAAGFVVGVSDVVPLPWRAERRASSPFPGGVPVWSSTVRAWRR